VTFDVVSPGGDYVGGVIAPGLEVMTNYLYQRTALLPRLTLSEPPRAIGKTTHDAMMSGAVFGYRGLVREILARLSQENFCGKNGKIDLSFGPVIASMPHCMNIRKLATITVLVVSSFAATNVAPTKAELESMYDKAFREFNAANYAQALKELDAIDARQPDLAESQNLRGVILMRQAEYD